MKRVIFSIDLNVGQSEPAAQLTATLRALCGFGEVQDIALGRGEWQGVPERFIQARVALYAVCATDVSGVRYAAAAILARELQQDCVAVRVADARADRWRLVNADGEVSLGCPLAENPVILAPTYGEEVAEKGLRQFADIRARVLGADWDSACARYVCQNGRINPERFAEVCHA